MGRQRAETQAQEKARELSMLTVDNRQLQYRLDKIEADFRQEADKVTATGQYTNLNYIVTVQKLL